MYRFMALGVAVLVGLTLAIPGFAQEDDPTEDPTEVPEPPAPPVPKPERAVADSTLLSVFEWGVDTLAWDGSPEPEFDAEMLPYFYDVNEVPITAAPVAPEVEKPEIKPDRYRGARGGKPIIYFACDKEVTFNVEVSYNSGAVTWMYPKPARRTNAATVQWDGISLYRDDPKREHPPTLPELAKAPADHWANFSREGATTSLVTNGECERYLFYEGNALQPIEADVFKNAKGDYVVRNYSEHPLVDVRVALKIDSGVKAWYVKELAAAVNGAPVDQTLNDSLALNWVDAGAAGALGKGVQADGASIMQSEPFERAWKKHFFAASGNLLSYRRSYSEVEARVALKVTAPLGFETSIRRSGWVFLHDIDLSRQAEIEGLVAAAMKGDDDSAKKLTGLGAAAIGAIRRVMTNGDESLARRLAAAKLFKRCTQG